MWACWIVILVMNAAVALPSQPVLGNEDLPREIAQCHKHDSEHACKVLRPCSAAASADRTASKHGVGALQVTDLADAATQSVSGRSFHSMSTLSMSKQLCAARLKNSPAAYIWQSGSLHAHSATAWGSSIFNFTKLAVLRFRNLTRTLLARGDLQCSKS